MSPVPGANMGGIRDTQSLLGRCRINEETGCYSWAGATRKGCGVVWVHGFGTVTLPKAFAILRTGEKAAPGRMWVPRCGNTLCCTPSHRFLGTRSDLMKVLRPTLDADHRAKIKAGWRRSEHSRYDIQVKATILASEEPATVLGPKLGLKSNLVSRIRSGVAWSDARASSVFSWRPGA